MHTKRMLNEHYRAIDYQTGQVRWNHEVGSNPGAGILSTDTGITFTGDGSGNVLALRTTDGTTLWHAAIGSVSASSSAEDAAARSPWR